MLTALEIAASEQRGEKRHQVRGRPFARGISGNPKGRAAIRERAAELYATMAPDFGELSATDTVLLNQACLLLARSERVHRVRDIDVGVRMSGEARRLLLSLQRKRGRERDAERPSLSEYLAATYPERDAGDPRETREPSGRGGTAPSPRSAPYGQTSHRQRASCAATSTSDHGGRK
jgi:hypothetical protein